MKNKKRIICISISIIGILLLFKIYILYKANIPYEEIPFEYVGSALGKVNMVDRMKAEDWADEEYVYNFWDGYFIIKMKRYGTFVREKELVNLVTWILNRSLKIIRFTFVRMGID